MTEPTTTATTVEIEIETYRRQGRGQLRFKRGWDDALYMETGDAWPHGCGFGHPAEGLHKWELRKAEEGYELRQQKAGVVVLHYPIGVSDEIAHQLMEHNGL